MTCAAALLITIYWKRASNQVPRQLTPPEPHENDNIELAFTVRDLPGRGKGMIAVRDIRVSITGVLRANA